MDFETIRRIQLDDKEFIIWVFYLRIIRCIQKYMDADKRTRLQYFLTIMDTIHDYCDTSRSHEDGNHLQQRVLQTLIYNFTEATEIELDSIEKRLPKDIYELYKQMYMNYKGAMVPYNFEQRVCDVILKAISTNTSLNVLDIANPPDSMQSLCGAKFIKYVLDKNTFDNNVFCMDPKAIQIMAQSPEQLQSIYAGSFEFYESQTKKKTIQNRSLTDFTNFVKIQNAGSYKYMCLYTKDITNYVLKKSEKELLFFDEIGVKKSGDEYVIYQKIGDTEYIINFPHKTSNVGRGLTLFLKAIVEIFKGSNVVNQLESAALSTIAQIFKISCDKFGSSSSSASLKENEYILALYDLKRSMDYLPIKACANANTFHERMPDTSFCYVSADRLATMYSIIQGCPSLLTKHDKTASIFLPSPSQRGGGFLQNIQQLDQNSIIGTNVDLEEHYDNVPFDDLIDPSKHDSFTEFITMYQTVIKQNHMNFLWYVIYKTLFSFMIQE